VNIPKDSIVMYADCVIFIKSYWLWGFSYSNRQMEYSKGNDVLYIWAAVIVESV